MIGFDTVVRIVDTKYYKDVEDMLEKLQSIAVRGNKGLVAGRIHNNAYQTLGDLTICSAIRDIFEDLPDFRYDISSTEVRNGDKNAFD